jgi:hypothetical protein
MHVRLWFCLTLGALSISYLAVAQTPSQSSPPAVRVSDGGANGPMQSIFIPPKAGAPFSLTLAAEWTRPMNNGGSITLANERRIVRDSKGRIYQERWILVPKNGKVKSEMNVFQITDPDLHTWFNCEVRTKVCELLTYHFRSDQNYQPAIGTTGPLPNGQGFQQHEDLGEGSAAGVDTHGYRETVTVNAGVMGNDRDMVSTREFWYSPQLGIDVISIVDSPTTGKQVFTVKNLSMIEPEESLFVVPGDYKIVDHRTEH